MIAEMEEEAGDAQVPGKHGPPPLPAGGGGVKVEPGARPVPRPAYAALHCPQFELSFPSISH